MAPRLSTPNHLTRAAAFLNALFRRAANSRDFTVSLVLHGILVVTFGTSALFQVIKEPSEFVAEESGFVAASSPDIPPSPPAAVPATTFPPMTPPPPQPGRPFDVIRTEKPGVLDFPIAAPPFRSPQPHAPTEPAPTLGDPTDPASPADTLTSAEAYEIGKTVRLWSDPDERTLGIRQREFEFTAFIGKYHGGDWNSTVRVEGGRVTGGSLPNLLYIINKWSRDRIKTHEDQVRVIPLDSDELLVERPPFVFITGTRDFQLTDKEIENLRRYLRIGGCIWGDSSIPGLRSRFDLAFRREMRRVIPDAGKDFEALPNDHPILSQGYFPEITSLPAGINFYRESMHAIRLHGEIAVLHTANDYGDMWQIGINEDGEVDLRRDAAGRFVAVNPRLWDHRHTYIGNIAPEASRRGGLPVSDNLVDAYKFGTNVVFHLLTRWNQVAMRAPSTL